MLTWYAADRLVAERLRRRGQPRLYKICVILQRFGLSVTTNLLNNKISIPITPAVVNVHISSFFKFFFSLLGEPKWQINRQAEKTHNAVYKTAA